MATVTTNSPGLGRIRRSDLPWTLLSGKVVNGVSAARSSTENAAALNAAIAAAPSYSTIVLGPGTIPMGAVTVTGKTGIKLLGVGTRLLLDGASAGIKLAGATTGFESGGIHFSGSGVAADAQAAYWSESGGDLADVWLHHFVAEDVPVGVSLNSNLSGTLHGGIVSDFVLRRIVGIASGQGYGIHIARINSAGRRTLIARGHIQSAGRHSLYIARGGYVDISDVKISRHRADLTAGEQADGTNGWARFRPAIVIARGGQVSIRGVSCDTGYDGALEIVADPEAAGALTEHVDVDGLVVTSPQNDVPPIKMGETNPTTTGQPSYVTIRGGRIVSARSIEAIRHYCGKSVRYEGVDITISGITATTSAISLYGSDESGASANYTDDVVISRCPIRMATSNGSTRNAVRLESVVCTSAARIVVDLPDVQSGVTLISNAASITDPGYRQKRSDGGATGIYAAGDTTPDVSDGVSFLDVANSGATTITTLDGGVEGQEVTLRFRDANTTMSSTGFAHPGSGDQVSANYLLMTYVKNETTWWQVNKTQI